MPVPSLPERPHFYPQERPNTCAIACLRIVLSAFRIHVAEDDLAREAGTDEFGTALANLVEVAENHGLRCEAKVLDFPSLKSVRYPIVYLDGPTLGGAFLMHAVVVEETELVVKVLDPSRGELELDLNLFREAWDVAGNYAVIIQALGGTS